MDKKLKQIKKRLDFLYNKKDSKYAFKEIKSLLIRIKEKKKEISEKDSILITYADSIKEKNTKPLKTFKKFSKKIKGKINTIHFLPFFPYSSDDGFSVIDYRKIDPKLGDWTDVNDIGKDFRLMFDFVLNHVSVKSKWFKEYLKDDPEYKDYFFDIDPKKDLSKVFRPRTHPLLTKFKKKHVWTTFSADQVDINIKNPKVLVEIVDIMIFFIKNKARLLRFDAIAYLWKKIGTKCLHLKETHEVVKLLRDILDIVDPNVMIVTETNVPHKENISYFGNNDEAQMVYQFPLPPLTLHAILKQDSRYILDWIDTLGNLPKGETFFNFLASHDGIGVLPAKGLIPDKDIGWIAKKVIEHKGYISYKSNPDGSKSPYELNINYFDALSKGKDHLAVDRFMAAQAIMLSLAGIPGIYIHSLLGSRNYQAGVKSSGIKRRINREKLDYNKLMKELQNPKSIRSKVFKKYLHLLEIRKKHEAFSPYSKQKVLKIDKDIFSIERYGKDETITVLINITDKIQILGYDLKGTDLISKKKIKDKVILEPYQVMWVKKQ